MNPNNLLIKLFPKSGLRIYSENIFWSFLLKAVSLVISLITVSIIARLLGPETFGVLNYIVSFGTIIAVLVNLGIDNLIYKQLSEESKKREEILGTGIVLKTIAGLFALFIISIASLSSGEIFSVKILIVLFGISYITQPLNLLFFDFLKERKTNIVAFIQITTLAVSSVLRVGVVYFYHSLTLYIIIQSLEALFSGMLSFYFLRRHYKKKTLFTFSKQRARSFMSFVIPLTLFSFFSEIYSKIDILMLRHIQSTTTVGLYSAAVRLTEVWYFVSYITSSTFFPALTNAFYAQEKKEYFKRLSFLSYALIATAAAIAIFTLIFGKLLITLIYSMAFYGSIPLLYIYIFSLPGIFILSIFYQDLLLRNRVWMITFIAFVPAVVNVVLNLFLIPTHGAAGAALATVISYNCITLYFFIHLFLERKK